MILLSNQKIFIEKIMGDLNEGDCVNTSVDKVEKRILVLQKKKELDIQKKRRGVWAQTYRARRRRHHLLKKRTLAPKRKRVRFLTLRNRKMYLDSI